MTQATALPPLTKDLIEAFAASAVAWAVRLLGDVLHPRAERRRGILTRFVRRVERFVEHASSSRPSIAPDRRRSAAMRRAQPRPASAASSAVSPCSGSSRASAPRAAPASLILRASGMTQ